MINMFVCVCMYMSSLKYVTKESVHRLAHIRSEWRVSECEREQQNAIIKSVTATKSTSPVCVSSIAFRLLALQCCEIQ